MAMDWKLAIKINREALVGIVAGLVACLAAFEGAVCLPRGVYQSLGLSLHKAESRYGDSAFYCLKSIT